MTMHSDAVPNENLVHTPKAGTRTAAPAYRPNCTHDDVVAT